MRTIYGVVVVVLLGLALLTGSMTRVVLADDWIESPFTIEVVSGPTDGEVDLKDQALYFSAPGHYQLRVVTDPEIATGTDDEIALGITAIGPVDFDLTLADGPVGGQVALDAYALKFSEPGPYRLRFSAVGSTGAQVLDDQIEVDVKSSAQTKAELAAITEAAPAMQFADSATMDTFQLFLPLVTAGQDAAMTEQQPAVTALEPVAAAASAVTAFGAFDKRYIPIELQAWWTPAYGHLHLAALVPFAQPVSGKLEIPVRVVLHANPSVLRYLSVHTDEKAQLRVKLGDLRCSQPVCAWAFTITLDTTKMSSGWRELRLRAETVSPDGSRYFNSSNVPVLVQNGGTVKNAKQFCDHTALIGRGWYDGFDYTNAIIECVPTAPVHGAVTFRVRAQNPSQHLKVDLDKTHMIPAVGLWPLQAAITGATLFDKDGDFSGSKDWVSIPIDTRTLSNGWHSLAVQSTGPKGAVSQCSGCPTEKSFPAGVAKMWFYVQN
ncbi:MAG: hypothetical protein R3C14_28880 [Caldilineaceae bacterium]